jgi:hypothetical protein
MRPLSRTMQATLAIIFLMSLASNSTESSSNILVGYLFFGLGRQKWIMLILYSIAQVTWPRTPPSVKARFPDALIDCDTPGVWQVKTGSPDRDAKGELAKILRGKNSDIWVVCQSGRNAFKDHIKSPIPEMLSVQDVNDLRRNLRDGELFVRTSST